MYIKLCAYIFNCIYIHTHRVEYYSAIEKNGILPFAATQMDLEGIMLSEMSQIEESKYCMISHMWNLLSPCNLNITRQLYFNL